MDKSVFQMKNDSTISLFDAAEAIRRELVNKGKAELVEKIIRDVGDSAAILFCFERFYFRTGSYASVTILLTESQGVFADIIACGGGKGMVNTSLGANRDLAVLAMNVLLKYGFKEIND